MSKLPVVSGRETVKALGRIGYACAVKAESRLVSKSQSADGPSPRPSTFFCNYTICAVRLVSSLHSLVGYHWVDRG